ncbi:MAG TPA: efflux RND transporter periplasmic adaptor subunit [Stellaceae bacterium]|nr:efflux RND transporter periplasmic adaptor subunit [Stellaceae bacterium]
MFRAHRHRIVAATLTVAVGLSIAALPRGAAAHDDDEGAPLPPSLTVAPRVVAHSNLYDLVGVARRRTLSIYLVNAASDAPVVGAKIDVDADGRRVTAVPGKDGLYTLAADWVAQPGHHDAVFTIIAKDGSDLLAGTLDVPSLSAAQRGDAASALPAVSRGNVLAFLFGMLAMLGLVLFKAFATAAVPRLRLAVAGASSVVRAGPAMLADLRGGATQWLKRRARERVGAAGGYLSSSGSPVLPERAAAEIGLRGRYGGRVEAAILAVICLLLIATAALFLISRGVLAHEGDAAAAAPTAAVGAGAFDSPHRLLDGSLFVPEFTQRLLHVRTVVARVKKVARSVRMVGRVIPDPGTSGEVHAMVRGRLEPVGGKWPRVGQKVEKDQVLAWVVPVVNPIDRGIILQQVAQVDREIGRAQDALKKLAVTRANAAALAEARDHLTNLLQRREAIGTVLRDRDNLRAPLRAPSSGVIAASFAVAGQVVDEQDKLFQVVDLKRLWVEAYAYDIMGLGQVLRADGQSSTGRGYRLDFISRGPQLERQTIPLFFRIADPDPALSVGSLLSVLVETTGERSGVVVPRTALTRDASGQEVVWQHTHPESFVPVPVRVEPVDGRDVLIAGGLEPDSRIVVKAAELLSQIR